MELPVLIGNLCVCCGDTLAAPALSSTSELLCRPCRMAPPLFERAVAYGPYEGRMLAEAIGQLAGEAPAEMLVVPVPLHRSKYAQRSFNQARSLATHALTFLGKSHPEWRLTLASSTLMRLRATQSQAGLTPRQRRLNVRGAFTVFDPAAVAGKHILLVDDILTTGATARAAAKTLMEAGADSVWVATLARARRFGYQRGTFILYDDVEENSDLASNALAATMHEAFTYSSHDQPSF